MHRYASSVNKTTVYYDLLTIYTIGILGMWPIHVIWVDLIGHSNYTHVYTPVIYYLWGILIVHNLLSLQLEIITCFIMDCFIGQNFIHSWHTFTMCFSVGQWKNVF